MECGRRGRRHNRRNNSSQQFCASGCDVPPPCRAKPWSFLSGIFSFLLMSSLMALIYLMLEYHCNTCNANCNMSSITRNIDDIKKNLSQLMSSYEDLEQHISTFSKKLPRLEGQIEIMEALANTLQKNDFMEWNPKSHLTLPYVDVYLAKMGCNGQNVSRLSKPAKHIEDCTNGTCAKWKHLEK